ncbi:unnamed protein product [Caenorhabditis auriculariae]|uniref:Uncharacterized protein n=1 Tax=Caenorhabditis auriculariae TaxID=2777116 RepID=A0A8S1HMT6_9PELO|nr:unnamed protein product [Caenorhabditis auriculariae]
MDVSRGRARVTSTVHRSTPTSPPIFVRSLARRIEGFSAWARFLIIRSRRRRSVDPRRFSHGKPVRRQCDIARDASPPPRLGQHKKNGLWSTSEKDGVHKA